MKHVDVEEAVAAATEVPVKKVMTRAEKLTHWAGLVRRHPGILELYHLLEHRTPAELATIQIANDNTALGIAARDQVLTEQGFTETTVAGAMKFFGLSLENLHAFSCNCGGAISNVDQAHAIEWIAAGDGLAARFFMAALRMVRPRESNPS